MTGALTPRQREVFDFISAFIAKEGFSPTLEEITAGMGMKSKAAAHRLVSCLEQRGVITRRRSLARSIEICSQDSAEHHLKAVLASFGPISGISLVSDAAVVAAKQFLAGRVA